MRVGRLLKVRKKRRRRVLERRLMKERLWRWMMPRPMGTMWVGG